MGKKVGLVVGDQVLAFWVGPTVGPLVVDIVGLLVVGVLVGKEVVGARVGCVGEDVGLHVQEELVGPIVGDAVDVVGVFVGAIVG